MGGIICESQGVVVDSGGGIISFYTFLVISFTGHIILTSFEKVSKNVKSYIWYRLWKTFATLTGIIGEKIRIVNYKLYSAKKKNLPFKVVFKCPLTEVKISNALLKLIFWQKCIKFGCMITEMKIHLMIIFIFLSFL